MAGSDEREQGYRAKGGMYLQGFKASLLFLKGHLLLPLVHFGEGYASAGQ
jgi:hypothetical protein